MKELFKMTLLTQITVKQDSLQKTVLTADPVQNSVQQKGHLQQISESNDHMQQKHAPESVTYTESRQTLTVSEKSTTNKDKHQLKCSAVMILSIKLVLTLVSKFFIVCHIRHPVVHPVLSCWCECVHITINKHKLP